MVALIATINSVYAQQGWEYYEKLKAYEFRVVPLASATPPTVGLPGSFYVSSNHILYMSDGTQWVNVIGDLSNYVTLDGVETLTGNKSFTGLTHFGGLTYFHDRIGVSKGTDYSEIAQSRTVGPTNYKSVLSTGSDGTTYLANNNGGSTSLALRISQDNDKVEVGSASSGYSEVLTQANLSETDPIWLNDKPNYSTTTELNTLGALTNVQYFRGIASGNINDVTALGNYQISTSTTGDSPVVINNGHTMNVYRGYDPNEIHQIFYASDSRGGGIWKRYSGDNGSSWGAWKEFYHSENSNNNTTPWNAQSYSVGGNLAIDDSRNFTGGSGMFSGNVIIGGINPPSWTSLKQVSIVNSGNAGIAIQSGNSSIGRVSFGSSGLDAYLEYNHSNSELNLNIGGTDVQTLSSSGIDITGDIAVGGDINASSGSFSATGDGVSVLKLDIERAWDFKQRGTLGGTNLSLEDLAGGKSFQVYDNISGRLGALFTPNTYQQLYGLGDLKFETTLLGTKTTGNHEVTGSGSFSDGVIVGNGSAWSFRDSGNVQMNNGTSDTPGMIFSHGNNSNIGIDNVNGALRITKNLNETSGSKGLVTIDDSGIDVIGNIVASGTVTALDVSTTASDIRLKHDIKDIENLESYDKIEIKQFHMNSSPDRRRVGVVADSILLTHPELVLTLQDSMKTKTVNYIDLLCAKVARLEQLKDSMQYNNAKLKQKVTSLEERLQRLEDILQVPQSNQNSEILPYGGEGYWDQQFMKANNGKLN